jgi:hypothetical protein
MEIDKRKSEIPVVRIRGKSIHLDWAFSTRVGLRSVINMETDNFRGGQKSL